MPFVGDDVLDEIKSDEIDRLRERAEKAERERDEARAMLPTAEEREAIRAVVASDIMTLGGRVDNAKILAYLARTASDAQQTPVGVLAPSIDRVPRAVEIRGPSGAFRVIETVPVADAVPTMEEYLRDKAPAPVSDADIEARPEVARIRAMPAQRKRPGATLTVEHDDGSTETTTYGGDHGR